MEQSVFIYFARKIHPDIDLDLTGYTGGTPTMHIHTCVALDIAQQDGNRG